MVIEGSILVQLEKSNDREDRFGVLLGVELDMNERIAMDELIATAERIAVGERIAKLWGLNLYGFRTELNARIAWIGERSTTTGRTYMKLESAFQPVLVYKYLPHSEKIENRR